MEMPRRGGPNFSFAGFILLTAFGTFLWKSIPLESSRPPTSDGQWHPSEQHHEVPARLWQDPFKAVFEHTGSLNSREPEESTHHEDIPDCNLNELNNSIKQKNIRIMAVMLTAGPDAELNERRRQRRYAVVSGLGTAGLVPKYTTSLHFCYLEKAGRMNPITKQPHIYKYIVPYEWYLPDPAGTAAESPYAVLLLWLNETIFASDPMDRFANIAKQIAGCIDAWQDYNCRTSNTGVGTRFIVLGPARSDTLGKLALRASREISWTCSYKEYVIKKFFNIAIEGLHILSPIATAPRSQLTADKKQQENLTQLEKDFAPKNCLTESNPRKPCVSFQRTISTDDRLAQILARELVNMRPEGNKENRIALISEWDTPYGRSLPKVVKKSYCDALAAAQCQSEDDHMSCLKDRSKPCNETYVFEYSYLRGIDGRIKGAISEKQGNNAGNSKNGGLANGDLFSGQDKRIVHRPSGTAQFDYLRRLANNIRVQNAELAAEGKRQINAIGILGSDVYDKLLVLRALRPQFPHVLFFTTDLDAQLLHPADFRWTRNLIVASSFDLNLQRGLQGNIPPFRNNYQTSLFYSTLLATTFNYPYGTGQKQTTDQWLPNLSSREAFSLQIPPLLFEVGRNGAARLSIADEQGNATVHPATPASSIGKNTAYVFLILLLLILVVHQFKPLSGWIIFWSIIAWLLAFSLAFVAITSSNSGEPMSLTQGISIWPTVFIRYATVCLSIYLISLMIFGLKANCARISRDFLKIKKEQFNSKNGYELVLLQPATLKDLWESKRNWLLKGLSVALIVSASSSAAVYFSYKYHSTWWALLLFPIVVLIPISWFYYKSAPWISRCIVAIVLVVSGIFITRKLGAYYPPVYWSAALLVWFIFINRLHPPFKDLFSIKAWLTIIKYLYTSEDAHTSTDDLFSINKWMSKVLRDKETKVVDAKNYWFEYCDLGQPEKRWYRALSAWLLFMAFGSLIFSITGFPVTPCRGDLSCSLDKVLTITSVSSMLLLIFLVLDEFRLTIYWLKGLIQIKNMNWAGISENQHLKLSENLKYLSHERFKIELIAERTEEIGRLIYYPFLVIIIVLISRSSYFDNWGLPQGIAIVVAINILLLISAGTKIRYEAEKCRRLAIKKLDEKLMDLTGCAAPSAKTDLALIQQLLDEVKGIHNGAFQPFTEQPVLRASLLLFGAISITVGEYMTLFN